jgi:hypothetical protein
MTAVGVARPRAQGQAITSAATMRMSDGVKPASTQSHHTPIVASAMTITAGTKATRRVAGDGESV